MTRGVEDSRNRTAVHADALLLVANWDSAVGYAWWLMESFWVRLAEHYRARADVILAYPAISTVPPHIAQAPLRVVEEDFSAKGLRNVLAQCRFLRDRSVRIIYFSDRSTWDWRYAFYRLCGVQRIIIHDHTPGCRPTPNGLKRLLKRMANRAPLIRADAAIGATEFVRRRLIEVNGFPPAGCHVAPNGLAAVEYRGEAADLSSLFAIPRNRKVLAMTGRATRYKGVDFALRCMAALREASRTDLHFLFIGDGPDLPDFIEMAGALGVDGYCTFAGKRDDVPALLAGAYLAIHPSRGEVGYSLSILEYMRAGLPVIVPDNPSVCGATVHNVSGIVFPEGDVDAASRAVERLLDDRELHAAMCSTAKEMARGYSLKTTYAALLGAFDAILSDKAKIAQETA